MFVKLYKANALIKYEQLKKEKIDAITLIELMEHIKKEDLAYLVDNLFGFL